jgi:hypothetical protein
MFGGMSETRYDQLEAKFSSTLVIALETCTASIARLDGRVAVSPIARPWRLRAAWAGYARALQLQGIEIDEIDVLSWGCALPLPERPRRASNLAEFDAFPLWWGSLMVGDNGQWRDQLPFTPIIASDLPVLLRAIDLSRQYALRSGREQPWLALPRFLHHLGMTQSPLPCLVGGAKALRSHAPPSDDVLRGIVRSMTSVAQDALETLDVMESSYRGSARVLTAQHRPGALVRLLALSLSTPVLSPKSVAQALDFTLSGAGKLLERAEQAGMLVEISGRKAWKTYLTPDLATAFGFRHASGGRSRRELSLLPGDRALADVFEDFDREIASINERLAAW